MHQRSFSALFWLLPALLLSVDALALETVTLREEAVRYQYGEGVERDYARAYQLYCIAALQGDGEAAYHLGWMHLNGHGMAADDALAVGWFKVAGERGDPYSQRLLDEVLTRVEPRKDSGCPLRNRQPDRATIETWVRVLAAGYELDANLLLAVIEVESRFNPQARSPKNARGLMQLLPATARRFEVKDIRDPFENLKGGMAYLRWLLDHYEGNLNLSLAAYNAGEHIVKRYGGIPPYRETRHYVKNVNRIYNQAK
ncbi:MAG: transglycosylase SLT domain-containing protein [Gammaproteobacteria bacterium]|nr:transglycosylase SLT domain-containing protein [Gammaproteobacteria bacterium]